MSALAANESIHFRPIVLPGEAGGLFTVGKDTLYVAHLSLSTGEHRVLFEGVAGAYLPSGHLVYAVGSEIVAAPFDVGALTLTGAPRVIARNVRRNGLTVDFAVGGDTLAYALEQSFDERIVWVDRTGTETPVIDTGDSFHTLRISPDGSRFVADVRGGVWVFDFARGTQTLVSPRDESGAVVSNWSPDGSKILWTSGGNIRIRASDGTGDVGVLLDRERTQFALSWTPGGKTLAITDHNEAGNRDILLLHENGEVTPLVATDANENAAAISPDGAWIAYQSRDSGRDEVYVQPFPGPGRRALLSSDGGRAPVWARNGRELFYRRDTAVMAVTIATQPSFSASRPTVLFDGPYQFDGAGHPAYDVSPDGKRFLMIRQDRAAHTDFNVIVNLEAELTP